MDFTRREAVKSLAVFPFIGSLGAIRQRPFQYKSLFKVIDLDVDDCGLEHWPYKLKDGHTCFITNLPDINVEDNELEYQPAYIRTKSHLKSINVGSYKVLEVEKIPVPLSRRIEATEAACMELVLCTAVDRNIIYFDKDSGGKPDGVYQMIREADDGMKQFVTLDQAAMKYYTEVLGGAVVQRTHRMCLAVTDNPPFYIIKRGPYTGMVCLTNKDVLLAAY